MKVKSNIKFLNSEAMARKKCTKEVFKYTDSEAKELCWKLLESVINEEHLKMPLNDYKNDFEIWFKENKKQ